MTPQYATSSSSSCIGIETDATGRRFRHSSIRYSHDARKESELFRPRANTDAANFRSDRHNSLILTLRRVQFIGLGGNTLPMWTPAAHNVSNLMDATLELVEVEVTEFDMFFVHSLVRDHRNVACLYLPLTSHVLHMPKEDADSYIRIYIYIFKRRKKV